MSIYIVIFPEGSESSVIDTFSDRDQCEVRPGVWLVHGDYPLCEEVVKLLNIDANNPAIVISAGNLTGFSSNEVVEKINYWERRNA